MHENLQPGSPDRRDVEMGEADLRQALGAIVGCLAFISVYNGAVFMRMLTQAPERVAPRLNAIVREPLVARVFGRTHSR